MTRKKTKKISGKETSHVHEYGSECGVTHADCIGSWKGTCDRAPGHDGSHHCSSCNMVF
jgi:hypothetical protein